MLKYVTHYSFYEENINGNFNTEPHEFSLVTEEHPTPENDLDVLFECLEVDQIACKNIMVEKVIQDKNGQYLDMDTAVVEIVYLAYTQELSSYINWEKSKNLPPIYKINREKSKIIINNI